MTWRNRIVGTGEESPQDLVANPKNWRTHPVGQETALSAALDEVGWVDDVIVNRRSGLLVDGHLRTELAAKRGEHSIPVKYVDLDDREEAIVLATFDPIGALAETDDRKLDALRAEIGDVDLGGVFGDEDDVDLDFGDGTIEHEDPMCKIVIMVPHDREKEARGSLKDAVRSHDGYILA